MQARALIDRSRTAAAAERDRLHAQAATLLRQTTAVRNSGETVPVDDASIASMLAGPDGINRALAILDAYIAIADRAVSRSVDPSTADARLREIVGTDNGPSAAASVLQVIVAWINDRIRSFFGLFGLPGSVPDLSFVPLIVAGIGVALVAFIVATLGRGVRERLRRETVLPERAAGHAADPVAHLHLAEAALASGRTREAIHELYLYALGAIAARELIRYDPALTDRELLLRAAAIPNADALRDLVALYERAWFGLREPDRTEAEHARSLATKVAA